MKRAVILFLAILFLGTSVAGSGWVVWQMRQDDKKREQDKLAQEATEKLKENNVIKDNMEEPTTTPQTPPAPVEGKLEGGPMPNFTPSSEPVTELQITDLVEGTGAEVTASSKITAHYTGAIVSSGVVFQSSKDTGNPFTSGLGTLIAGWQSGIPGMKVGGTRRLVIPYMQAYGESGSNNIPPKSDLVFDIELLSVE